MPSSKHYGSTDLSTCMEVLDFVVASLFCRNHLLLKQSKYILFIFV